MGTAELADWRARLRAAIDQTGKKHSFIASQAGIAPATLSRLLNGRSRADFEHVAGIALAAGVTVSWVLDEPHRGFELSMEERETVLAASVILLGKLRGPDERSP